MRSKDSRSTVLKPGAKKRRMALVALPTAAVLGLSLIPFAGAQSSLPGGSSLSDSFAPGTPPQRDPINTEYPEVEGLPEGVDINRVEYITPRHLKVYIQSAAMPEKEQVVQICWPVTGTPNQTSSSQRYGHWTVCARVMMNLVGPLRPTLSSTTPIRM